MNGLIDTEDEKVVNSEFSRGQERKALKLVEILIDKIIKRLEENSFEPTVQDALKAIQLRQKLAKTSQAEEMFLQALDDISQSEQLRIKNLESQTENLQAQILKNVTRLRYEVKNGVLPVKIITDAFNRGRSEQCRVTYQRVGRLLYTMGFQKARAGNSSAIFWNEKQIDQMLETFSPSPHREEDRQIPSPQAGEEALYSPSLDTSSCSSVPRPQGRGKTQCQRMGGDSGG